MIGWNACHQWNSGDTLLNSRLNHPSVQGIIEYVSPEFLNWLKIIFVTRGDYLLRIFFWSAFLKVQPVTLKGLCTFKSVID